MLVPATREPAGSSEISARTKAALAAAKRRGTKLGGDRGSRLTVKARKSGNAAVARAAAQRAADVASTVVEIAAEEQVNESYVSRLLRLTLLAPDIIEAIIEGGHPPKLTLATLMQRVPISWREQRATICE